MENNINTTLMTQENFDKLRIVRERKEITKNMERSYLVINHKALAGVAKRLEYLGRNEIKTNHYVGVKKHNICLVKVADDGERGAYCIINKKVMDSEGKEVDLVKKLRRYSFNTSSNGLSAERFRTRTGRNKLTAELKFNKSAVSIEAIIFKLITDKVNGESTGLEIHHESSVYDHRIECCEQITKEEHSKKSSKSRKNGEVINTIGDLIDVLDKLAEDDKTVGVA